MTKGRPSTTDQHGTPPMHPVVEQLLTDILPLAMGASCMYGHHKDADPTVHCCDWGPVVDRICELLAKGGGEA